MQKHHCTQCGDCCREHEGEECVVIVFPSELESIASACSLSIKDFIETFCEWGSLELSGVDLPILCIRFEDHKCLFLNDRNLCDIYEHRPYQCRMFDEGYFSGFILSERSLKCMQNCKPEILEQGNQQEYGLAMELLSGYDINFEAE